MNIVNYDKNGLGEIKNIAEKFAIKIDSKLFSVFEIAKKNIKGSFKNAIPFALEAKLLDDIDDLEFFINKNDTVFNVAVIKKQILSALKLEIKSKKLDAIGAYPEFMFVAKDEDRINYIENDDSIIFRLSVFSGGSLPKDIFFQMFNEKNIQISNDISTDYQLINFLQYDINEIWQKTLKPYIGVFALFALAFVIHFATVIVQNSQNQIKLNNLQKSNEVLFKLIFPNIGQIVDIRVQAEQKMSNLSKQKQLIDNDFLSSLIDKKLKNKQIQSLSFDKKLEIK